jgi:stage II sporulation protein AA (anti-sigma F factor antagonist)
LSERRKQAEIRRNFKVKERGGNVMGLSVEVTDARHVLVVRLTGELDHHTAEKVRNRIDEKLMSGSYVNLVFNLSGLTFMDSSGLGVLLGRYKRVSQLGGHMILCCVNPSISRLMELSGLFKILPLYQNEQAALEACEVTS